MAILGILKGVSGLANVAKGIIEGIGANKEKRDAALSVLANAETSVVMSVVNYQQEVLAAQRAVIVAEAQGKSWLQRSWRPITMLTFLVLVVLDHTGLLAFRLAPEAWTLLQLGLGGYVVGRSVEKSIHTLAPIVRDMQLRRKVSKHDAVG